MGTYPISHFGSALSELIACSIRPLHPCLTFSELETSLGQYS
jgi:hypothetical protein